MRTFGSRRGQGMVEYIIIVVVVAIACLAIFSAFGDRLRGILGGVIDRISNDSGRTDEALNKTGMQVLKDLDKRGGGETR